MANSSFPYGTVTIHFSKNTTEEQEQKFLSTFVSNLVSGHYSCLVGQKSDGSTGNFQKNKNPENSDTMKDYYYSAPFSAEGRWCFYNNIEWLLDDDVYKELSDLMEQPEFVGTEICFDYKETGTDFVSIGTVIVIINEDGRSIADDLKDFELDEDIWNEFFREDYDQELWEFLGYESREEFDENFNA